MPAAPTGNDRLFTVVIDQRRLDEDLAHSSTEARAAGRAAADAFARDGIRRSRLHPCMPEDREGVALPGCVKTYIPDVNGAWGMVFALRADEHARVYLELLAFGQRHPKRRSTPSVYVVAAARRAHL